MEHALRKLRMATALALDHIFLPQAKQRLVPKEHGVFTLRQPPIQLRAFKRRRVLRLGQRFIGGAKRYELVTPAFAHGFLQLWIVIVGKEQEGIGLVVLLPHEEQRCFGRQ